jgi:L-fuconolactonase
VIVDTHHHFWNPSVFPQSWMREEHAAIDRAFEPRHLEPLIGACGVTSTVVVQSAADDRDTDYLFEITAAVPWVRAVIAWCDLQDETVTRRRLSAFRRFPTFRGIRHLIHQEQDAHWILRTEVQPALAALEENGIILELPVVFPDHLGDIPELARRYPALTIVIDHLGKPPLGTDQMPRWTDELQAAAAASESVIGKISGLNTLLSDPAWKAKDLEPAVRSALEAFGPARLVCGSDWPVALLNGTYERVMTQTVQAIQAVAPDDAASGILSANAHRIYALESS